MKKTQRWMELLSILLEEQKFLTVAELAKQVSVSPRRIHSDLQDMSLADKKTEYRHTSSLHTKTERGDLSTAAIKSL